MQTLGVGIIGFGFIGKTHAYGYTNMPLFYDPVPVRTRLVGVATSCDETARKAAEIGGFEFGTANWRELIERDDIQIINICSPNSAHEEQLVAAMGANKHIYCDKPLVVGSEAIARVQTALESYKGIGQMTFNYRFFPATIRAKELIAEGFLGNVIGFRAEYLHSGSVDPDRPMGWKQIKSEGGGVLQDLGSHIVDLIDWYIGPFESILAESRILYPKRPRQDGTMVQVEADDQTIMIVRLKNGTIGTLEASKIATGTEDDLRFEIHGDKGAIRFNLMNPNWLEVYDLRDSDSPLGGTRGWKKLSCVQKYPKPAVFPSAKATVGWLRAHMHCLYNFLNAVANGQPTEPSLQRGLYVQKILACAEDSARKRQWLGLA